MNRSELLRRRPTAALLLVVFTVWALAPGTNAQRRAPRRTQSAPRVVRDPEIARIVAEVDAATSSARFANS